MKIPNVLNLFKKESKVAGIAVTGYSGKVWPERNYNTFAKESYMMNVIAFRCIDLIAKSCGSVNWKLFIKQGDEVKEVEQHPINSLLARPNPEMGWNYLQYEAISYLVMAGNSYIERISPDSGPNKNIPKELWVLRNDRMAVTLNKEGKKEAYVYTVNGVEKGRWLIDPITGQSDILHLKLFHPLDDIYGMGITEPAAREIDTSNSSIEWNKKLLDNSARPGMMIFYENNLQDKQYDRIKKDLETAREGKDNAGKSLIIEGGKDAKPYGFSPTEMDWINSNLELSRRICAAYGVPAQMVGIPDTQTYSNYREARASFWEDTVMYYLNYSRSEYNSWFFTDEDNYFINYILDDVPALQYKRDLMWERAQKSDFITPNEKREMVGMDNIGSAGDVILIPATMLPLGTDTETEDEIEDEEKKAIDKLIGLGHSKEEAEALIGKPEEND